MTTTISEKNIHGNYDYSFNSQSSMTVIDALTLDCSPACRSTSSCLSDKFMSNPFDFIATTYELDSDNKKKNDENKMYSIENRDKDEFNEIVICEKDDNDSLHDNSNDHYTDNDHHNHQCVNKQRQQTNIDKHSIPDFLAIFDNELSSNTNENFVIDMELQIYMDTDTSNSSVCCALNFFCSNWL